MRAEGQQRHLRAGEVQGARDLEEGPAGGDLLCEVDQEIDASLEQKHRPATKFLHPAQALMCRRLTASFPGRRRFSAADFAPSAASVSDSPSSRTAASRAPPPRPPPFSLRTGAEGGHQKMARGRGFTPSSSAQWSAQASSAATFPTPPLLHRRCKEGVDFAQIGRVLMYPPRPLGSTMLGVRFVLIYAYKLFDEKPSGLEEKIDLCSFVMCVHVQIDLNQELIVYGWRVSMIGWLRFLYSQSPTYQPRCLSCRFTKERRGNRAEVDDLRSHMGRRRRSKVSVLSPWVLDAVEDDSRSSSPTPLPLQATWGPWLRTVRSTSSPHRGYDTGLVLIY